MAGVLCPVLLQTCPGMLACRGFHTDSEALYGVGDGRHDRPDITESVIIRSVGYFEFTE